MNVRRGTFGDGVDEGWGSKSPRQTSADLDITPMIDVTFLLLIFFMVTSTMQVKDLDIPAAAHGVGVDTQTATEIVISGPGKHGFETSTIWLDERQATLDDVRAFVEVGVQDNRSLVIIRADGQVPHGFVQEVTRVVNSVSGATFSIGVRDKQEH